MHPRLFTAVVVALAATMALPSAMAQASGDEGPALVGRAVLPADTLADGPPTGALVVPGGVQNGILLPRPSQGVLGFSAVVAGRHPGEFLAMPDNGFGAKNNSADFLIRAYYVRPDFKTARGGSGTMAVDTGAGQFISFRDPDHRIGFPIVNEASADRLLTGGDIDPESLQRGSDGDLWVGDEFGPWILHFDATGRLLDAPFATPGGLMSPNNPFLGGRPATQPNSRGFEAMAISPNGAFLYPTLEGATVAEAPSTRRIVFEFSTRDKAFTGRTWEYRTEQPAYMVADMWGIDRHHILVVERDGGRGLNALFRSVYVVDLTSVDAGGALVKTPAVDLTAIPDPDLVSLPAIHPGDVGLGDPFRVTCESV
ncbi:MAG TPA: esterase-like activity of phytase family protein, partial [Acidimicrobiales bacterium]